MASSVTIEPTSLCELCSSGASEFHSLWPRHPDNPYARLRVCSACYYLHEIQRVLITEPRSAAVTSAVTSALRGVYELLVYSLLQPQ